MAERNRYREALIDYQQTRRRFYEFEDSVKQNLREIKRNIDRNKILFELDRRTVQVEIQNVEINRYELEKPVGPNSGGSRLGATTAQNLTNAIIGLNGAQDSFLGSWVEYEVLRRNLDYDLGTMQLDANSVWIDPGAIDASIGLKSATSMGIELDCQFCNDMLISDASYDSEPTNIVAPPESILTTPNSDQPDQGNEVIIPPTPQLNLPKSGRSAPSAPVFETSATQSRTRSPGWLFNPVNVTPTTSRQNQRRNTVSTKPTQSLEQKPTSQNSNSSIGVANRIANQAPDSGFRRTSSNSEVDKKVVRLAPMVPAKEIRNQQNPNSSGLDHPWQVKTSHQ